MSKNNSIYIWRIFFTYLVAFYHLDNVYRQFNGGWYLGVEFFFIVSGFLVCKHVLESDNSFSPIKYTFKRRLGFIPIYVFSAILMIIYAVRINHEVIDLNWFWALKRYIGDFFLVFLWFGFNTANMAGWYLCSLLSATFVISLLLKRCRKAFFYVIGPVSIIGIYFILIKFGGQIEPTSVPYAYFGLDITNYMYLLRGFAGMCLGCYSYLLAQKIPAKKFYFPLEIVLVAVVLAITYKNGRSWMDIIWVAIFFAVVTMAFKDDLSFVDNRYIRFFNQLAIHIYLDHYVMKIFWSYHYQYTVLSSFAYIIAITVLGFISYIITKPICDRIKKIKF